MADFELVGRKMRIMNIPLPGEAVAADKEPYGDVPYGDPGYLKDGKKRYPLDTEAHVRAALSYFAKPSNHDQYTSEQRAKIHARIVAAYKRLIDSKGPPSEQSS